MASASASAVTCSGWRIIARHDQSSGRPSSNCPPSTHQIASSGITGQSTAPVLRFLNENFRVYAAP